MKTRLHYLLPIVVATAAAPMTHAATLFSDNFSDGTVDGWSSVSPSGTGGTLSVVDATSNGLTGNALRLVSSGTTPQGPAILLGSTYTLANTNDYITLTFDFVVDVNVSNTGFFRYGLVNDTSDSLANGLSGNTYFGQISSSATQQGRVVQSDAGLTYGATVGTNYQFKQDTTTGWLLAADTVYTANLTLTRTLAGVTATTSWSKAGTSAITATQAELLASPYLSFDAIGFAANATAATVLYDNVLLTSNIPEPTTWSALMGGLGMLALIRRRRQ